MDYTPELTGAINVFNVILFIALVVLMVIDTTSTT